MITFVMFYPHTLDSCGLIPYFLDENDPRSAVEQFNERYAHGGGWRPMEGWSRNEETCEIIYPGDSPLPQIAVTELHRREFITIHPHAWVCIMQLDGSFEVARMD